MQPKQMAVCLEQVRGLPTSPLSLSPLSLPSPSPLKLVGDKSDVAQVGRARLIELVDSAVDALSRKDDFPEAASQLCRFVSNAGFAVQSLKLSEVGLPPPLNTQILTTHPLATIVSSPPLPSPPHPFPCHHNPCAPSSLPRW